MNRRSFALASAALAAASAASLTAAAAPVVHVRGTVVAATATSVDVRTASGLVHIPYGAATIVQQLVPIARDAIVPNAYVGIATDGTAPGARARYVTVFPEAARGRVRTR
jgi:uncharacterized membrane protein affecting hemolysin expression